jgi:hypothetical protein
MIAFVQFTAEIEKMRKIASDGFDGHFLLAPGWPDDFSKKLPKKLPKIKPNPYFVKVTLYITVCVKKVAQIFGP